MQKKIILCDADDTILDLCVAWVKCLNKRHGTNILHKDVTDWDISLFFPGVEKRAVYDPVFEKDFWKQVNPVDGCFEVLKEINDRYELYIVTATNYQTCDTKVERILELYPFLDWQQFVVTSKKQLITGDYLIDDGLHNFAGGAYKGILYDRPHNQNVDVSKEGLIRVHSWNEISSILL